MHEALHISFEYTMAANHSLLQENGVFRFYINTGATELTHVVASPVLPFLGKQGQHGSRESCILLENGPTRGLVAMALQHSSLAVREFRTASEERCGRGYDRCVQPDVVVPETHRNSLCELKL